jgi:DNA-binding MarR family transcriptional regulator
MLFDLFVAAQRVRRVLAEGMAKSGLRPDEYAVYSLLFEHGPLTATDMADQLGMPLTTVLDYLKAMTAAGHLDRTPDPSDGRALQLRLSRGGVAAQKRAHDHWNVVRVRLESELPIPIGQVRRALQALDEAAINASKDAPRAGRARPTWGSVERPRPKRLGSGAYHAKDRGRAAPRV